MIPSIPGIKVDIEGQRCLQSIVANLFHSKTPSKFPGAQPISFAAAHFGKFTSMSAQLAVLFNRRTRERKLLCQ